MSVEPPPQRDGSHERVLVVVHAFPERERAENRPPTCQPRTASPVRGGAHRRQDTGLLPTIVRRMFGAWIAT